MDSALSTVGLPVALGIIMLGLGLSLTPEDFRRVGRHPKAVVVALAMLLPTPGGEDPVLHLSPLVWLRWLPLALVMLVVQIGIEKLIGNDDLVVIARRDRLIFLAGVFAAPMALMGFVGTPETNATDNIAVLIAAGLLVGVGTRIANGCTSGHGVCGISRLSFRGIIATVFYILAGGLTMVFFRHLLGVI